MTTYAFCVTQISEPMIIAVMAADITLLAAALIVVSLIDVGLSSSKAFSVELALRNQRVRRLGWMLQVLVLTSVSGFIMGVLTIWVSNGIISFIAILLGTAATLEFGIITLLTLAILVSGKKDG